MSSEESNCGDVDEDTWKAKAEKYEDRGVKALEVRHKNWRSTEVNCLYYALDKEAFKSTTALHARFHGFKENASDKVPKGDAPLQCMSFDLNLLKIENSELGKDDLRALEAWESWEFAVDDE
ncbi:hypothetical protein PILCRDRAFT_9873 [Piloderma croceum F 1598]|uniref:Uncharacterized protein n=1 Tax=Piloderma croceum (strain F 1598) TaxID=765440 RepID=A0A0C3BRL6_PILCF|nr:hypothetical protein PILCRDRAFT_9873 [Piloderma croceum F 1598]